MTASGMPSGKRLLVAAARVLRQSLRGGDIVVRLGGDEFAALLPDADETAIPAIRARIESACAT